MKKYSIVNEKIIKNEMSEMTKVMYIIWYMENMNDRSFFLSCKI